MIPEVLAEAKVAVIGGGVAGCSLLYHLAKLGLSDAVLLERNERTSASTWHAAGLCTQFSASYNLLLEAGATVVGPPLYDPANERLIS